MRTVRGPSRWSWLGMIVSSVIAGALVPILLTSAALPSNSWIGLKSFAAYDGTLATCSLGAATGTDSVWSAVTGTASLDIVQVGSLHAATGNRWFAAYGRGEPGATGSAYTQVDLGPDTDSFANKYTVQLIAGSWSFSIDGVTRLRVSDTFRNWTIRAAQVQNEVETVEPMGGTAAAKTFCVNARAHSTAGWSLPAWSFQGVGPSAGSAATAQGADWFRVWQ